MDSHLTSSTSSSASTWKILLLVISVLFISTVSPRLAVLGGLPATDEGFYAYYAQLIHHSLATTARLPDAGPLELYPLLLSWVLSLKGNTLILLRAADMLVALCTAAALYGVLVRESGNRMVAALLTLLFAFSLNSPIFIQNGFKNSMVAAFLPLLLAVRIAQDADANTHGSWVLAGVLTALGILLRETFLPFAVLGAGAIYFGRGARPTRQFILGGTLAGALIVMTAVLARGSVSSLIEAYRSAGIVYTALADQRVSLFVNGSLASLKECAPAVALSALALIGLVLVSARRRQAAPALRGLFWLVATALPIIEPASKIGFPYHFSACLIGMAGLCACSWRHACATQPNTRWPLISIALLALFMLGSKNESLAARWKADSSNLAAITDARWPDSAVQTSNYLLAADALRKAANPGATLSASGFMFTLYPLTGFLPPNDLLSNLSAAIIKLNLDSQALAAALKACPPDLVMTTFRKDWPGADALEQAVVQSGIYAQIGVIPVDPNKVYGTFGGNLYRRIDTVPPCETTSFR